MSRAKSNSSLIKPGIPVTPARTLNPPSSSVVRHQEIRRNWAQWHHGSACVCVCVRGVCVRERGVCEGAQSHTSNQRRTAAAHCVLMLSNVTHFLPLRSIQKLWMPLNTSLVKIKTMTRLADDIRLFKRNNKERRTIRT